MGLHHSVYAVALGVAYAATALFGLSFALGAFCAGMALAESPLSQRATEEAQLLERLTGMLDGPAAPTTPRRRASDARVPAG